MRWLTLFVLAAALALCSCGDGRRSLLPKSGGRPYEVLLLPATGERDAARPIGGILAGDMEGLPQPEPLFDVSLTDSTHFNQAAKLARSIVIVNIDPALFTDTRIRYEKNVWARPQMVVYVNAPDTASLRADLPRIGKALVDLLVRFELNNEIAMLNAGSNTGAEAVADSMFGCRIKIPGDMKASRQGHGCLWLSDNAASGMRNICIYSYRGNGLSPERALAARDSVMRENIKGERDGMYMQTVVRTVTCGTTKEHGREVMVMRGLWEMKDDAMGGPFVAHSVVDTPRGRVIVAEAFVYAPEMKKRNLLRKLEAALYTLRTED